MTTLKDRLAQARQDAGLSQAQLAKAVGAGQSTIASIENGRNKGSSLYLDLAKALGVNVEWLMAGTGPKKSGVGPSRSDPSIQPPWPFPSIPEEKVRKLTPTQLSKLEGAIALALGQLDMGLEVAKTPSAGSFYSLEEARDEFPMRMPGIPAPWEGGKTTKQMEREGSLKLSLADSVIANVAAGDPPAANDRFEKVPELADVRLSAGDGIEADGEEQTGMIQFRRSFLRSVGADGGRGRVVYAKGDSMEPIIRDGAALLVVPNESLTLRDLAAGGVYAINYDGKMIVKTVVKDRISGRWVARSFNPAYPDVPLENGHPIRVLGQVVWAGARLRDDEAGQWVRS